MHSLSRLLRVELRELNRAAKSEREWPTTGSSDKRRQHRVSLEAALGRIEEDDEGVDDDDDKQAARGRLPPFEMKEISRRQLLTILELIVSPDVNSHLTFLALSALDNVIRHLALMAQHEGDRLFLLFGPPLDATQPPCSGQQALLSFPALLASAKPRIEEAIEKLVSESLRDGVDRSPELSQAYLRRASPAGDPDSALPPQLADSYFSQLLCGTCPDVDLEPTLRSSLNIQLIAILIAITTALIYCKFGSIDADDFADLEMTWSRLIDCIVTLIRFPYARVLPSCLIFHLFHSATRLATHPSCSRLLRTKAHYDATLIIDAIFAQDLGFPPSSQLAVLRILCSSTVPNLETLQLLYHIMLRHPSRLVGVPVMLCYTETELFRYLFWHLEMHMVSSSVDLVAFMLSIFSCIFFNPLLRPHFSLHLELYLRVLISSLSKNHPQAPGVLSMPSVRRLLLNQIIQLCYKPEILFELYINFDCSSTASDVFESLCQLLYENSVPESGHVLDNHLACFEGLLNITRGLHDLYLTTTTTTENDHRHLGQSSGGPLLSGESIQKQKTFKKMLISAAERFNAKPSEGIEFLDHSGLLASFAPPASSLDDSAYRSLAIARFLRSTPFLQKTMIGEFLGNRDQSVLRAFCKTFPFEAFPFEECVRQFLQSFRLPGESALIERILEAFASRCFECTKDAEPFKTQDAIYVFTYSIVMLNTDLHNPLVKTRMTEQQFIRNVRGINAGVDLPEQLTSQVYRSIAARQIQLDDSFSSPHIAQSDSNWGNFLQRVREASESAPSYIAHTSISGRPCVDKDLFSIVWTPTISALSLLFDKLEDLALIGEVIDAYHLCASVAAMFNLSSLLDNLVITLSKFSSLLNPAQVVSLRSSLVAASALPSASERASGSSVSVAAAVHARKTQIVARTLFAIVRKHLNFIREGWGTILRCILNLYARQFFAAAAVIPYHTFFDFTPSGISSAHSASCKSPTPSLTSSGSGGSLLGGFFDVAGWWAKPSTPTPQTSSDCISHEPTVHRHDVGNANSISDNNNKNNNNNRVESEATLQFVHNCQLKELVVDLTHIQIDSLLYLIKAIILSSTPDLDPRGPASARRAPLSERASVFCLQLLCNIAILNRHRIMFVWLLINEHLCAIISAHAQLHVSLVAAAVGGVLQLCSALLDDPYIQPELIKSLHFLHAHIPPSIFNRFASNFASALEDILVPHLVTLSALPDFWVAYSALLVDTARGGAQDRIIDLISQALVPNDAPSAVPNGVLSTTLRPVPSSDPVVVAATASQSALIDAVVALADVCPIRAFAELELLLNASRPDQVKLILIRISRLIFSPFSAASTRRQSLSIIQAVFFTSSLELTLPLCIEFLSDILFPLANGITLLRTQLADIPSSFLCSTDSSQQLQKPSVQPQPISELDLEETSIRVFALLVKSFLHFLPRISAAPEFDDIWLRLFDHAARFHSATPSNMSREAVQENVKNALLVALTTLTLSLPLWENTKQILLTFYPSLLLESQIISLISEFEFKKHSHS